MGGCASRPKEFDSAAAPEPIEAPETTEKVVATQEGGEVEKEAPLVDLSEPAEAAPAAAEEDEKKKEEEGEKNEEEGEKKETNKTEGETAATSS